MSSFTLFPAIDLRDGRVVRLQEGDPTRQKIYGDDPAAVALSWLKAGATWLHVVNLDGAFGESDMANQAALRAVLETAKDFQARVQFGGGIRSMEAVAQVLDLGGSRVVLGTSAVEQPQLVVESLRQFGAERIAVGIDARDGLVRIRGWRANSGMTAIELALQVKSLGVRTVVFTDIRRDGLGSGLNVASTRQLAKLSGLDVIASGGVHTLDDVLMARDAGVSGVIIGRALYEGTINLKKALQSTSPDVGTELESNVS